MKRKVFEDIPVSLEPEIPFTDRLNCWCEEKRKAKDRLGYSNDYVAQKTGVSSATIGRIMARNMDKDIRWSTIVALDRILPSENSTSELSKDISKVIAAFEVELAHVRDDAAREVALYKDKISVLEVQIAELKVLVAARGRMMEKLIDKS